MVHPGIPDILQNSYIESNGFSILFVLKQIIRLSLGIFQGGQLPKPADLLPQSVDLPRCIITTFFQKEKQCLVSIFPCLHPPLHLESRKSHVQFLPDKVNQILIDKIIHSQKRMMIDHVAQFLGSIHVHPQTLYKIWMGYLLFSAKNHTHIITSCLSTAPVDGKNSPNPISLTTTAMVFSSKNPTCV